MAGAMKLIGQTFGYMLELPHFDAVTSQKELKYEERKYSPAMWVSTTVENISHEKARSIGFQRLFKYITGENEEGVKIDMTAPVTTKVVPGAGPNCENTFTVSFFIPKKHQDKPIPPKSKDVFIEQYPEMTVYAIKFPGFPKDQDFIDKARELSEMVGEGAVNTDYYYTAGYDSPFKLFNRRSEVWLVKKSESQTSDSQVKS